MVRGWWLPEDLRSLVEDEETVLCGDVPVSMPVVSPEGIRSIASTLQERSRDILGGKSVGELVSLLDGLALRWLDPDDPARRRAVGVIPGITGFSAEMVSEAIELENHSSRATHLWAALKSELGDPACLDGFVSSPHLASGGRTRAVGPGLVGAVFSANIPALPHLTIMRSILVKSGCLGRSSRGEPAFLPMYLETLHEMDPEVASCFGVIYWEREDRAREEAFLASIDFLVAYGGREAEMHLRAAAPDPLPVLFHGHRLGFAVVSGALGSMEAEAAAKGLAYDATVFDQHACLAPHVVLVEGSRGDAEALADQIAIEMEELRRTLPPRTLGPAILARLGQARAVAQMEGATVHVPPDDGPGWTVVVEDSHEFPVSPLDRYLRVVALPDLEKIVDFLRPLSGLLQNAAVALPGPSGERLKESLVRLGVSRICLPGQMGTPSMMWHHDGHACIGAMVRWCDDERMPPEADRRPARDSDAGADL